jgi:hypothetical protein
VVSAAPRRFEVFVEDLPEALTDVSDAPALELPEDCAAHPNSENIIASAKQRLTDLRKVLVRVKLKIVIEVISIDTESRL